MPHALLCFNPFKERLSADAAATAVASGLRRAGWSSEVLASADGGPGTLDALRRAVGGRLKRTRVRGPLGEPVDAAWLLTPQGEAVVESAQAIGLELVPKARRDPLAASSHGLGQILLAVHRAGARKVWVGLGGSATTDGGTGMARALGWRFLDAEGSGLPEGGASLVRLATVQPPARNPLPGLSVGVLCDVRNPLFGPRGAARVFAPQKGADRRQVLILEQGLRRLAARVRTGSAKPAKSARSAKSKGTPMPDPFAQAPGAGAAGGLGFGLMAFARGRLVAGAPRLLELAGFAGRARAADWILSGEGCLDRQSLAGKLPAAVAQGARAAGRPCAVFCGLCALAPSSRVRAGFNAVVAAPAATPAAAARALERAAFAWAVSAPRLVPMDAPGKIA